LGVAKLLAASCDGRGVGCFAGCGLTGGLRAGALNALAVVLFAADVDAAIQALEASGLPGAEEPVTLDKF
jgi:hypothetical protein